MFHIVLFTLTTRASRSVYHVQFAPGDWLVFGSETRGLSEAVRPSFAAAQVLRLPMMAGQRSLTIRALLRARRGFSL